MKARANNPTGSIVELTLDPGESFGDFEWPKDATSTTTITVVRTASPGLTGDLLNAQTKAVADLDAAIKAGLQVTPWAASTTAVVTVVAKVDLYREMTDAEFTSMQQSVAQQPERMQGIFNAAINFRSDAPEWALLNQMATQLFGATRAAQLLTPTTTTTASS